MKNIKIGFVCGVGINDSDYQTSLSEMVNGKKTQKWKCPIYAAWANMLRRCYSPISNLHQPTYLGCTVVKEWHLFSLFREWALSQPWEGNEIDKDILYPGNKVYGPETCVFVSCQINVFLVDCASARGDFPVGVNWEQNAGKFRARCRNPFTKKHEYLGLFSDPQDAHEAWREKKHEHACRYADMQTDLRIAEALRRRYLEAEND